MHKLTEPARLSHRPSFSHIPFSQSLHPQHHPQPLHAHIPASFLPVAVARRRDSHVGATGGSWSPLGALGSPRDLSMALGMWGCPHSHVPPEHPKRGAAVPQGTQPRTKAPSSTFPFF